MTVPANRNSRGGAVALLVVAVAVGILLVAALGMLLVRQLSGDDSDPTAGPAASVTPGPAASGTSTQELKDALAARPMLALPVSANKPQPLVAETAGPPISIPRATQTVVPGGPPVATGFPQTPAGALAQLAAIDEAALSTTDLERVAEVYRWAAAPGAVPLERWNPHRAMSGLIRGIGDARNVQSTTTTFQVVQGQIKGSVGTDYVVACVLGEFTASLTITERVGAGDCQRMVWASGRWWIGAGSPPADAPSAWPGSADAVRAGWRELRRG